MMYMASKKTHNDEDYNIHYHHHCANSSNIKIIITTTNTVLGLLGNVGID